MDPFLDDAMNISNPPLNDFSSLDFVGAKYDPKHNQVIEYFRDLSVQKELKNRKQSEVNLYGRNIDTKQLVTYSEAIHNLEFNVKQLYSKILNKYYQELKIKDESYLLSNLGQINYEKLLKNSHLYIFNSQYMITIAKVLNTILSKDLKSEANYPEKIRAWINHLSIISEGSFGRTIKAGINAIDDYFAIKYSIIESEDLFHEYLVGRRLNELRDRGLTYCFVYTYNELLCTKAIVEKEKNGKLKLVSWAADDTNYNSRFLIIEYVANSQILYDVIKNRNNMLLHNYLSIFYCLFFSLLTANKVLDYSHRDLHTGNILVAKISDQTDSWTAITVGKRTYYIRIDGYIPFIIDNGLAAINIDGMVIGPDPSSQAAYKSHFRGLSIFLQDIYKFMFHLRHALLGKISRNIDEQNLIEILNKVLVYFFEDGIDSASEMIRQHSQYVTLRQNPNKNSQEMQTMKDLYWKLFMYQLPTSYYDKVPSEFLAVFHKHITDIYYGYDFSAILISDRDKQAGDRVVLACPGSECHSQHRIVQEISTTPKDIKQLCYLGKKLSQIPSGEHRKMVEQFRVQVKFKQQNITSVVNQLNALVVKYPYYISEVKKGSYSGLTIVVPQLFRDIQQSYYYALYIWHDYSDLVNINHNFNCVTENTEYTTLKRELVSTISKYGPTHKNLITPLNELWSLIVKQFDSDASFKKLLKSNVFFHNELPIIQFILDHKIRL